MPAMEPALFLLVGILQSTLVVRSLQATCHSTLSEQEFPNCHQMSDKYALHWALRNDSVHFGIEIDQTGGWFALGLSEGGGMRGADMWVFSKIGSENWTVKDSFAIDYVAPTEDMQQVGQLASAPHASTDINIASVTQSAQSTALVFTRKLDTCDYQRDQVIRPKYRQPFIFAHSNGDWGYHGPVNRGSLFLVLDPSNTAPAAVNVATNETQQLPLLMPNITVPTDETSYLCTNFKAPNAARYQIISTNYSITPNRLVHHMLLYSCYRKPDVPIGKIFPCFSTPTECSNLYLVWVPGQEPEEMPFNTGFPFGAGSYEYFMIQVHYTNPEGKEGVKDSSGFIPSYTDKLRKNELGVLWIGSEGFEIPGGQESFTLAPNLCPSECTSKFTSDLNMGMSEFHMHQVGSRQTAQHLRRQLSGDFEEIVPLNYRDYYDFNWQGGTFILPGGETLVRGDALITTCTYNTLARGNVTRFGLASSDEMCYNFVRYWPAQKIDRCITMSGSEMNGTALVQCANQQEFFGYVQERNFTEYNRSVVTELIGKGFLIPYNTSQYQNFKLYNGTSTACAAFASNPSVSPTPQQNASSGVASKDQNTASSAAGIVAGTIQTFTLVSTLLGMLYIYY